MQPSLGLGWFQGGRQFEGGSEVPGCDASDAPIQ